VVHGASSSGQSVYIEPLETIEQNNELIRLLDEEQAEVHRIFVQMTSEIAREAMTLATGAAILAEVDALQARARFAEQLDRVYELFPRLKDRRHQFAGTLSGGEQQMCAIGRALMSRPKLLLMDEPSAGLAPLVVEQVFDLVRRIRGEGLTVLIVEQNVQQVLDVVDRAYLLEVGSIKLAGTSSDLKGHEIIRKAYLGL